VAKTKSKCECGKSLLFLSGADRHKLYREYKYQVVYLEQKPFNYSAYRCPGCRKIIDINNNRKKLSDSPWGQIQEFKALGDVYYIVSTAAHGGHMITSDFAKQHLPNEVLTLGIIYNNFYCFEEDCSWRLPVFFLKRMISKLHNKTPELAAFLDSHLARDLLFCLKTDFPEIAPLIESMIDNPISSPIPFKPTHSVKRLETENEKMKKIWFELTRTDLFIPNQGTDKVESIIKHYLSLYSIFGNPTIGKLSKFLKRIGKDELLSMLEQS